jgi:long-chain acyl-CoA synthetase
VLFSFESIIDEFFHTGDVGEFTVDGFLKITDRKKEIFKTSGGKYIIPSKIENKMKQSGFIEQLMVIGEGQKFPAALIQLNYDFVSEWAHLHDYEIKTWHEDQRIIDRIQTEIDHYNQELGKWERIKRFELTPDTWSIDEGHLTPTLKLKRKQIKSKYQDLYIRIYGS